MSGAGIAIGADVDVLDEPLTRDSARHVAAPPRDVRRVGRRGRRARWRRHVPRRGHRVARRTADRRSRPGRTTSSRRRSTGRPRAVPPDSSPPAAVGSLCRGPAQQAARRAWLRRRTVRSSTSRSSTSRSSAPTSSVVAPVTDPAAVRAVVACIASPAGTGLSAIAGRLHPVDRCEPGGVAVRLGGRRTGAPRAHRPRRVRRCRRRGRRAVGRRHERAARRVPACSPSTASATAGWRPASPRPSPSKPPGPWLIDVDLTLRLRGATHAFDASSDSGATRPRRQPWRLSS